MVETEPLNNTRTEPRIALSTASLLPLSIIPVLGSTRNLERFADSIKATAGLEILPTAAIIFELWSTKKLSISNIKKITSIHSGWAADRIRDITLEYDAGKEARLICKFLPSEKKSDEVVNKLSKVYPHALNVFHWPEDEEELNRPALEIHHLVGKKTKKDRPMTINEIVAWAEANPGRKLVIDISIRKLLTYFQSQGITDKEVIRQEVIKLLPYAGIIHFQAADESELEAVWNRDLQSDLAKFTNLAKEYAPEALFVIELDMFKALKKYKFKWKELYRRSVQFIKNA